MGRVGSPGRVGSGSGLGVVAHRCAGEGGCQCWVGGEAGAPVKGGLSGELAGRPVSLGNRSVAGARGFAAEFFHSTKVL